MPELPEVETVKRGLAPTMEGAVISRLVQNRADLRFPLPEKFADRLEGATIISLSRRAKYLLADLDTGETLLMHLGMSGSFRIESELEQRVPGEFAHPRGKNTRHDHVIFHFRSNSASSQVIYNDPRRFGYMDLIETAQLSCHPWIRDLGLEPTGNSLDGRALAQMFAKKNTPLKAALLDQRMVAGLGNIYVCEALWRSRLSPKRKAMTLVLKSGNPSARLDRLSKEIRATISEAIEAGGSSLKDHRQTDGSLGYFQHSFSVYDREGEPCKRKNCGSLIKRIFQSGRSTFFCPTCQK